MLGKKLGVDLGTATTRVITRGEGTLVVELDDRELAERLTGWQPPPPRYDVGVFARYRALVSSASNGAVLVPPA